jgi:hypothetical protein
MNGDGWIVARQPSPAAPNSYKSAIAKQDCNLLLGAQRGRTNCGARRRENDSKPQKMAPIHKVSGIEWATMRNCLSLKHFYPLLPLAHVHRVRYCVPRIGSLPGTGSYIDRSSDTRTRYLLSSFLGREPLIHAPKKPIISCAKWLLDRRSRRLAGDDIISLWLALPCHLSVRPPSHCLAIARPRTSTHPQIRLPQIDTREELPLFSYLPTCSYKEKRRGQELELGGRRRKAADSEREIYKIWIAATN